MDSKSISRETDDRAGHRLDGSGGALRSDGDLARPFSAMPTSRSLRRSLETFTSSTGGVHRFSCSNLVSSDLD